MDRFKERDLDDIRDPILQKALKELWRNVGGDATKFANQAIQAGVWINGRRQRVRSVRVTEEAFVIPIRDKGGRPFKGHKPDSNEFVDVWHMRDGTWKMVAVSTFAANQPNFNIEEYRPKDRSGRPDPTAKRIMRLQINDMGAIGEGDERQIVRVRRITNAMEGTFVFLDPHNATTPSQEKKYRSSTLQRQNFRRVRVD